MATGKPGADSASIVTNQQQGQNLIQLSTQLFNEPPVFWGRYFTSSSTTGVEYSHRKENDILRQHGIRVCPVARQTKHVNGSRDQGAADARANVEDLVNTFGAPYLASQGGTFYLFLDVEGAPSLSLDYYLGWAITIATHSADFTSGAVRILPCVYATQSDNATWQAVAAASAQGVPCHGAWVARWRNDGAFDLNPGAPTPRPPSRCPAKCSSGSTPAIAMAPAASIAIRPTPRSIFRSSSSTASSCRPLRRLRHVTARRTSPAACAAACASRR